MPDIEVIEIVRKVIDIPSVSVEEMAKDSLKELKKTGRINPIRYEFESSNE